MSSCVKCISCRATIPLKATKLSPQTKRVLSILPNRDNYRIKLLMSKINYKKAIVRCAKGMWLDGKGEKERTFKGLDRLSQSSYIKSQANCMEFSSSY